MSTIQTSSQIIAQALGIATTGRPSTEPCTCAYCGAQIGIGDLRAPFKATGAAFTDDTSLACRGSAWACGHCDSLLGAEALRTTGVGVFSPAGVRPFRKWVDVAAALTTPPEPPFVMVYATRNNQHMAWRAPVNLSRDLFYVRVGLTDLRIRRAMLARAVEACATIAGVMGIEATAKSLPHPFAALSPDLKEAHTDLRRRGDKFTIQEAAEQEPDAFRLLQTLSLGETWALRFVLTPGAGQP